MIIIVLLICLLIPACAIRQHKPVVLVNEQEARYFDIPIPAGIKPNFIDSERGYKIYFASSVSLNDMLIFYNREMDYADWQLLWKFESDDEFFMQFEKPNRWLLITLKSEHSRTSVSIINKCKYENERDTRDYFS